MAARARAGAPARAPRAGAAAASRRAPGARRRGARPRRRPSRSPPANSCQQRRDVAHALVHDGTQLRELPERPVTVQHEAKRARVCQVQERKQIVLRLLQRVRKAAECAQGQLPINFFSVRTIKGSSSSRPSSVSVVLLASKAAWQLALVKRKRSASLHTLPRRARAACRCRVCAATQGMPKTFVVKEANRNIGDDGGRGVIFFEGANKPVLIEAAIGRRPCPPQRRCWCVPCTE